MFSIDLVPILLSVTKEIRKNIGNRSKAEGKGLKRQELGERCETQKVSHTTSLKTNRVTRIELEHN